MARFNIGLTMAGAISAGAYSAGVFDFLIEALDAWEKRKQELRDANVPIDMWNVPQHDVVIPVISGASAGGMTGAIGLIAVADQPMDAIPVLETYAQVGPVATRLPRLFDAWVTKPALTNPRGGPSLLGTDDLTHGTVRSLLDGSVLDRIAVESLYDIKKIIPRPFLADNLHLFLTLSNLRGVPYDIGFCGGISDQPGYPMMSHGDWAHFIVKDAGTAQFTSRWADPYPIQTINFNTLPGVSAAYYTLSTLPSPWIEYLTAALATGAFPVGLPARIIKPVEVGRVMQRPWTIDCTSGQPPQPGDFRLPVSFPPPLRDAAISPASLLGASDGQIMGYSFARQTVNFVAVDGGMINNEPFELARWTLMSDPPNHIPSQETATTPLESAVIMIDPFPQAPKYDPQECLDDHLLKVITRIFPVLLNQVRFKPEELWSALKEDVFNKFLISPRRRAAKNAPLETYPLACGLLSGFGGFLDVKFRAHDYQLGRLNCFLFLRDHLLLPATYKVMTEGYAGLNPGIRKTFLTNDNQADYLPIIPLVGSATLEPTSPTWPRATKGNVEDMVVKAVDRADELFNLLNTSKIPGAIWRKLASFVWWSYGKEKIRTYLYWTVLKELILRDQCADFGAGLQESERKVLSALADPAYQYRTVISIAAEQSLKEEATIAAINNQKHLLVEGPSSDNFKSYTLKERAPSGIYSWPGISWVREKLVIGAPTIG